MYDTMFKRPVQMPGFHRFNITNQRLILYEIRKREHVKDLYFRSILSRIIILGLQGSLIVDIHYYLWWWYWAFCYNPPLWGCLLCSNDMERKLDIESSWEVDMAASKDAFSWEAHGIWSTLYFATTFLWWSLFNLMKGAPATSSNHGGRSRRHTSCFWIIFLERKSQALIGVAWLRLVASHQWV